MTKNPESNHILTAEARREAFDQAEREQQSFKKEESCGEPLHEGRVDFAMQLRRGSIKSAVTK
jgi:hypothetical protein